MSQHQKLFDKAEIEYTTPFLKLWMAFNSWYKKERPDVTHDRAAINIYKAEGMIKDLFLEMLNSQAAKHNDFKESVVNFIRDSKEDHKVKNLQWNTQSEYLRINPTPKEIKGNSLNQIAPDNKVYYVLPEYKEDLFSDFLENVYKVRCTLVHGDFDIENEHFIDLVKYTYLSLHPVLDAVFSAQKEQFWYCKGKYTDAKGLFNEGKMTVLSGSKIREGTANKYGDREKNKRKKQLEENGTLENGVYTLNKNIKFDSVNAAAVFCSGNYSNGWIVWKDQYGNDLNSTLRKK